MKIEKIVVVAIVVAALVVSGVVALWRPTVSAAEPAASPTPIAQPITPVGYPYSSLAILRSQRLSTDVVKLSASTDSYQTDTARRLLTAGSDTVWLVVDSKGDPCILSVGRGMSASDCLNTTPADRTLAPGARVVGVGFGGGTGEVDVDVVADGTPQPGAVGTGYRQVAPNIWAKGRGITSYQRPVVKGDPNSFPLGQPYASLAILRRSPTAADALPAAWYASDATSGPSTTVILSTVRFATTVGKDRVWVGAGTDGSACLIAENAGLGLSTACGIASGAKGQVFVGTGLGDAGDQGNLELVADGVTAKGFGSGARLGGLNVIVLPATKK